MSPSRTVAGSGRLGKALGVALALLPLWTEHACIASPAPSYVADLITIPREPVARQWTVVRVTVFREQGNERVLVPDAEVATTVRWEGKPLRAYTLEASDQESVFQARFVFPQPGPYSLAFEITPAGRDKPFQTAFVVRARPAELPPASTATLLAVTEDPPTVTVVDRDRGEVVGSVALPGQPLCSFHDRQAGRLWIAPSGSTEDGAAVARPTALSYDDVTLDERERLPLPFAPAAIATDGDRVFVIDEQANALAWLTREHPDQPVVVEVGAGPRALLVLPKRSLVCVANADLAGVDPFDSLSVVDYEKEQEIARLPVGVNPVAAIASADGQSVYVCSRGSNLLTTVDAQAWRLAGRVRIGGGPSSVVPGEDPNQVVVACHTGKWVAIVDLTGETQPAMFPVPGTPNHLCADGDPPKAVYLACPATNAILVLSLSGARGVKTIGVPGRPVATYHRSARETRAGPP